MMSNCIIINIHWPMHWLGEVLLRDEICKQIETLLLAGTSCRERWGQNTVFFVMMEQFQPLQQLIIRLVEIKAWDIPGSYLYCAVKKPALTGCPTPLSPPHSTYPQRDAWPQASLKQHCGPAQLFVSAQVELTDPNQQLLSKNDNFSPLLKEGSQVNCYREMCYICA